MFPVVVFLFGEPVDFVRDPRRELPPWALEGRRELPPFASASVAVAESRRGRLPLGSPSAVVESEGCRDLW